MTFESNISTTYGEMYGDLRDNVSSVDGFSVVDTSANGGAASLSAGEWFVIQLPSGEYVRILYDDDTIHREAQDQFAFEYGPAWDTGASEWTDQYRVSSYDTDIYGVGIGYGNYVSPNDQVAYTTYYDTDGFVIYVDRNEGDGRDHDFIFGMAEMTPLWDYSQAGQREAKYALAHEGQDVDDYNTATLGDINYTGNASNPRSGSTRDGYGRANPDSNFDNFVTQRLNIVASNQYSGSGSTEVPIGVHDLWISDESNGDSAHLDTIQDEDGNDIYTLVSAHQLSYGIKM